MNRHPISQRQEAMGRGWIFNFAGEDTLDMSSKCGFWKILQCDLFRRTESATGTLI